ncbi:hypothetical protein H5T51_05365, partial [Candidatus Bathyarchaeota archaeon]|nr:hypothetical protein [Candidatus Bathyarchaeota archaeon]
ILHVEGPVEKGDFVLLFNKHGECLGYGLVKQNPHKARKGLVIKNLLDIGDFLRREKKDETRPS